MYFAIIGHHEGIHLHALAYLHVYGLVTYKKHIIFFDTDYPERLSTCAALIKRWYLTDDAWILEAVTDTSIVGVPSNDLGKELKKRFDSIKRYKVVEILHSDKEIKEQGKEIFSFGQQWRWVITGYQDISLYEIIDFDKPCHGMEVGMMPAKLALSLINTAVGEYEKVISHKWEVLSWDIKGWKEKELITYDSTLKTPITVWDPFVWFGTTSFLSHRLGYPSIASDSNITNIKNNLVRRKKTRVGLLGEQNIKVPLTIRKHDVTKVFDDPTFGYADCIVSEWYLGRVVTHRTHMSAIRDAADEVLALYQSFCSNLTALAESKPKRRVLVMTIPAWIHHDYDIADRVEESFRDAWWECTLIHDIYARKWQTVGRQVLIAIRG